MESKLIQYLLNSKNSKSVIFYDENGIYPYYEFMSMINSIQSLLLSYHFCEKSNIIVALGNQVEAIAAIIAIIKCNLIAIPVSVALPNSLFVRYVNHVDAIAYISLNENQRITINVIDFAYKNHNNPNTCVMLFTSGTSGRIKAVELSETALISTISSVVEYMQCNSEDCFFIIKDYVHCSCLISEILVAIVSGSKICLYNPRLPFSILRKKIKDHKVSIMGVNPWIMEMICKQPQYVDYYKSIRLLVSSGSILTKELKKDIIQKLPFTQIINVYGLTEACSRVCAQVPGFPTDFVSVGNPINNVKVALSACGNDIYEILIKSKGNMLGYYNDEQSTKEKIKDGWIYSGDIGCFDSDNNLIILGRKDDLIFCASNKVDPNHVDSVIKRFSDVIDSFTFGIPDTLLGEKVVSIVEYDADWNQVIIMDIMKFCRMHLFSYECPSQIISVEKIPRTISGKVIKKEVLSLVNKGKTNG